MRRYVERDPEREPTGVLTAPAETRVTSKTGGQKGSKPCQLAWAPPDALRILGEVYGFGAQKYDPTNYRKGYEFSLSISAAYRHLLAFQAGEDNDPESGLSHAAHVAWHALALVQWVHDIAEGKLPAELDDRPCAG